MDKFEKFTSLIVSEIEKTAIELEAKYGLKNLHSFSLATDDDLRSLYHVVCTNDWVRKNEIEQDYEGIGFIHVEWVESATYLVGWTKCSRIRLQLKPLNIHR